MAGKKNGLCMQLLEPLYRELVKLIGYNGVTIPLDPERVRELDRRYGKDRLKAATDELTDCDTSSSPATVRLKPEVRKLAFSILGPAPEQESWYYGSDRPTAPMGPEPTKRFNEEKPKRPRRAKRKSSAAEAEIEQVVAALGVAMEEETGERIIVLPPEAHTPPSRRRFQRVLRVGGNAASIGKPSAGASKR